MQTSRTQTGSFIIEADKEEMHTIQACIRTTQRTLAHDKGAMKKCKKLLRDLVYFRQISCIPRRNDESN